MLKSSSASAASSSGLLHELAASAANGVDRGPMVAPVVEGTLADTSISDVPSHGCDGVSSCPGAGVVCPIVAKVFKTDGGRGRGVPACPRA